MKQFSSGQALVGLGLSAEGDEAVSVSRLCRGSSLQLAQKSEALLLSSRC